MTRDNHLTVSCRCGKIEITKLDGYQTSDLIDAAELGVQAERLCRRKRLKRWAFSIGLPLLTGAILVAGTGWWEGERQKERVVRAEELTWKAEKALKSEDYHSAISLYTAVISTHPTVRTYLSRSFCYASIGNLQASMEDCERALALDPSSDVARRTLERAREEMEGK